MYFKTLFYIIHIYTLTLVTLETVANSAVQCYVCAFGFIQIVLRGERSVYGAVKMLSVDKLQFSTDSFFFFLFIRYTYMYLSSKYIS